MRGKWIDDWRKKQQDRKSPKGFIRRQDPAREKYLNERGARDILLLRNNMLMKSVMDKWKSRELKESTCPLCGHSGVLSDTHVLIECGVTELLRDALRQQLEEGELETDSEDIKTYTVLGYSKKLDSKCPEWSYLTEVGRMVRNKVMKEGVQ